MALVHHVDVAHVAWSDAVRKVEVHQFIIQPTGTAFTKLHVHADERPS